jgi:hypothetical protein
MWVGPHPCQFWVDLIEAGVAMQDAIILFILKICYSNEPTGVSGSIASMLHSNDGPTLPMCDHCSNGSFARCYSGLWSVGTEVYCSSGCPRTDMPQPVT